MPAEEQQTQLTVVDDGVGGKALQHGHHTVPADLCQQSGTLQELLDTEGAVQLPLSPELFQAWLEFATSGAGATAEAAGAQAAADLSSAARLVEVSQFMRHAAAEERAASRIAVVLRRAHRRDLRASDRSLRPRAVRALQPLERYMVTEIPGEAGERLRAAISTLPPLAPVAAATVARHLTLCEALLLPPPFPAEALAHFLSLTAGVLDLSPPRVPAHTPAVLHGICRMVAPLLNAHGPLQAMHIPAPCLDDLQTIGPLMPHLGTLSSLRIVSGGRTYTDPTLCSLPAGVVAQVLQRLDPAALRHLSIDAEVSTDTEPLRSLLATFASLTSLRLPRAPLAVCHMPSLSSLTLTDVPDVIFCGRQERHSEGRVPARIHVAGGGTTVRSVCHDFCGRMNGRGRRRKIPRVATAVDLEEIKDLENLLEDGFYEDGGDEVEEDEVLCSGSPVLSGAVSLKEERGGAAALASTYVHFFDFDLLRKAWGPNARTGPRGADSDAWQPEPLPTTLHALAIALRSECSTPCADEALALCRRLVAGEVPHVLGVLCVLRSLTVPPRSALGVPGLESRSDRHRGLGEIAPCCSWGYVTGATWLPVTARPAGVAHPLFALEMLHYNAAPHHAPSGHSSAGTLSCAAGSHGLHTLRLSKDAFGMVRDLVVEGAPCLDNLRNLSLHMQPVQTIRDYGGNTCEYSASPDPDIDCVSGLTNLRTLSLQGVSGICSAERFLPPALTALLIHGHDEPASPPAAAAFGAALLRLRQLQCLEVEAVLLHRRAGISATVAAMGSTRMKAAFVEGLWPVLLELPLHLGAQVRVHVSDMPAPRAQPRGAKARRR